MNPLPPTTVTVLDAYGHVYLTVTIGGVEHDLGRYVTTSEAGAAMVRWLSGRGLTTALGSAQRLNEAQRLGSCCVTFDVERVEIPPAAMP